MTLEPVIGLDFDEIDQRVLLRFDQRELIGVAIMSSGQTLAGSTAIVTAAGQGLGEAIAKSFAAAGARVAAVDMDGSQAQRVATEIEAAGGAASALTADVSQSAAVENMVRVVAHPAGFLSE